MRVKLPYFITPHAILRFQERVVDIPAGQVIEFLQTFLQQPGPPVQLEYHDAQLIPIFRAEYGGRTFYVPVAKGEGGWPAVPNIIGSNSPLHKNLLKNRKEIVIYDRTDRAGRQCEAL